jgi:hypothetical protein
MKRECEDFSPPELLIRVKADCVAGFFQFLQRGIIVRAEVGCSLRSFLRGQLQLPPQFIEDHIQTIFLNGKPVDNIDAATVKDGCTLALSSAMPGLVGATMRREGYYASLRSQISHGVEKEDTFTETGFITLKLFNMVASDLGPSFLENGIQVTKEDLGDFIESHEAIFRAENMEAELDGKVLDGETLRGMKWADKLVGVKLKIRKQVESLEPAAR